MQAVWMLEVNPATGALLFVLMKDGNDRLLVHPLASVRSNVTLKLPEDV
jgi:hypothetical protein